FKFVKKYLNGQKLISDALNEFDKDVKEQKFPTEENSFK
ncbi:MAG: 3-methyl-2-oxobutanoate hydroxymethyltransferase, partial [Elusimicrobiaceae bacterium]|nr:3-methyl-2-oxobutanoate hydroxymethyltransferase [Elusimicrobiaceae bacterium]